MNKTIPAASKIAGGNEISILIRQLAKLMMVFDKSSSAGKLVALKRLGRAKLVTFSGLTAYHDILCFIRAYPDNAQLASAAEQELRQFDKRIDLYKRTSRDKTGHKLDDSGIVNTTTRHPYSYDLARQLQEWYPDSLELDWESNADSLGDELFNLLPLMVAWQENDTLDYDEELVVRDWLDLACGKVNGGHLELFLKFLSNPTLSHPVRKHLYESLEIELTWHLGLSKASRTLSRLPSGPNYYQRGPLLRRTDDLRLELAKPKSPLSLLPISKGRKYVRTINEVLAVRNRELYPISSANPGEVYINRPGRGLTIAIFGMRPEMRLPIESNFGAFFIRNGMPVGYGVAATLFDRVEIALNIFPAFRSGESAFITEQFFRLFYHHFGSRLFLIRNTQMGYGEPEALHAGAFWFYYKLGFRAFDPSVRRLAEREITKIRSHSGYRTPVKTMKRLSKSDVYFHADSVDMDNWQEPSLVNLGYVVTDYLATKGDGDRRRGIAQSVSSITGTLSLSSLSNWSTGELAALERLSPLLASIPGLRRWSQAEKIALAEIIRAKGGNHERRFVNLSNKHSRFESAVLKLASHRP